MSTLASGEFIRLTDIAKKLDTRPCVRTVWRWAERGISGVRLRTYRLGHARVSTWSDVEAFFAQVEAVRSGRAVPDDATPRSAVQRRRDHAWAVAALQRRGIECGES